MSGRRRNKVGIALAGGGPLGAIYEIGALVALERALRGVSLTDLDVYVGVSSGAFLAAGLANGMAPSGFVTLPVRRARSVSASWMIRLLRLQSATWSSQHREVRGAFGRR